MLHTNSHCRFCSLIISKKSSAPWNFPLLKTDNFTIVPTKGSLVEGWLLVIPHQHILSLASTAHPEELNSLLDFLKEIRVYSNLTFFEHGAAMKGSPFGCGIDHAHLHVAPLDFSLEKAADNLIPTLEWRNSEAPWNNGDVKDISYLALKEPDKKDWRICNPTNIPRQFFRRAIAREMKLEDSYDYDLYSRPTQAIKTVTQFLAPNPS